MELLFLKLNVKRLYAFFCPWNLLLNLLPFCLRFTCEYTKNFALGGRNYRGKVKANFLLAFQFSAEGFFQRENNDFTVLQGAALKNGRKKFSYLEWRGACCAQSFLDERIHFKEELLCKLHLNSCNQHTFKPAELKSVLISCCFSSLTYFIVLVGF